MIAFFDLAWCSGCRTVPRTDTALPPEPEMYSAVCTDSNTLARSSFDGQMGCLQCWANVHRAAVDVALPVLLEMCLFISLKYALANGIAGSRIMLCLSFEGESNWTAVQSGTPTPSLAVRCTHLHPYTFTAHLHFLFEIISFIFDIITES